MRRTNSTHTYHMGFPFPSTHSHMMKTKLFALAAVAALGSGSALAQKAGDWQVGAGWLHFALQDSSKPLTFTSPVAAVVPGSGAEVGNSGTLAPIGELGEARQWSPTILAKYYFNDGEAKLRPFVGLGATYVWYSDVK